MELLEFGVFVSVSSVAINRAPISMNTNADSTMLCIVVVDREYSHPWYDQQISIPAYERASGSAFYWKGTFLEVHHTLAGRGWNFYEIWIIITPVASGTSRQPQSTADFSNRNQAIDYVEKFGPMLRLLDSEEDFDFLAAEEGYAPEIAHSHRTVRYQALQGYQQELIADFANLCSAATAIALVNPDVARLLTRTRRALHRSVRYIALRMRLELLLPSPTPATKPSIFRKLLVRVIPRRNTPEKLLLAMNAIRNQLQLRP